MLRNTKELILLQLPKFLMELQALRCLTVDRKHHILYNPARTAEVLKAPSPRIEKLKLRFRAAGAFFDPSPRSTEPTTASQKEWHEYILTFPENAFADAGNAYPSLTWLELDKQSYLNAVALQQLPRNLVTLSVAIPTKRDAAIAASKALPPNLTSLRMLKDVETCPTFFSSLPRSLTSIAARSLSKFIIEDLSSLPNGLKT